jgi:hypothetical protein
MGAITNATQPGLVVLKNVTHAKNKAANKFTFKGLLVLLC